MSGFCTKCGIIKGDGHFCAGCGRQICVTCTSCGSINPYEKGCKFCFNCGEIIKNFKKTSSQILTESQYKNIVEGITDYVRSSNCWVSYQELAQQFGLANFLSRVNHEDEKSTIGQIIYRANLRSYGFETITYKFLTANGKFRSLRFIKDKTITVTDPEVDKVFSVLQEVYKDFKEYKIVDVSRIG